MIFSIIAVGVVLIFFMTLSLYLDYDHNYYTGLIIGMVIATLFAAEIIMICYIPEDTKPTAIDVYRNKTELEITSVNGIPIDTTVVWKDAIVE